MEKQPSKAKKWYETDIGVTAVLILCFPIGIYLMWRYASWSIKAKFKVTGSILLVVFLIDGVCVALSGLNPKNRLQKQITVQNTVISNISPTIPQVTYTAPPPTSTPKPVKKINVVVTSQIVKKVNGKYRYFFDIRNKDVDSFEGTVSILLYKNGQERELAGDSFNTKAPIESEIGTSVYVEAFTGPISEHGADGIVKFKYTVRKDNNVVNSGEGVISESYEDTENYRF